MDDTRPMESEKLIDVLYVMESERWNDALWMLEQLILEFPASAMALELEAMIFIMKNNFSRAEAALKKAAVITPASALLWYHYSRLEQLQSNYK